jgi:hypothetical protein
MNPKYTEGLDKKTALRRAAAQRLKTKQYEAGDKKAFKQDLPGDEKPAKKESKYNEGEGAGSLEDIAEKYNAPISALRKIYNKGLAAWSSSGHRPGASQHGWGRARVMSVLKGGPARKVDSKEWAEIEEYRRNKK